MGKNYHREVDGLRAIAIAAVVLYHAGIGDGGFVGVDVFFVISGYLITSLLLREHASAGDIDLPAFWARRFQRILPAALTMLAGVICFAVAVLPASEAAKVGYSALATAMFAANLFFQHTTGGYFDGPSDALPLLHMWSLGVEEQFYLVWPALMILALRWRPQQLRRDLACLALVSFLLAEHLIGSDPNRAFYSMPGRFWELAVGGLIATLPARRLPAWIGWAGLALLAAACLWPMSHFPGYGALPAVAAAGLVVAAVHGGATNRLLASPPLVGLGLISYSLYLWHWPLLAYYRATSIGQGSPAVRAELCAAAVLLAIVSYRYIEQPWRRAPLRRPLLLAGTAVALLSLSACAVVYVSNLAAPAPAPVFRESRLANFAESDRAPNYAGCHRYQGDSPGPECRTGHGPLKVAIWGDSFALTWEPLAWRLAAGSGAIAYSMDGCPPLLGFDFVDNPNPACVARNSALPAALAGTDVVIITAYWQRYAPSRAPATRNRQLNEIRTGLARTLAAITPSARQVLLIAPTPVMLDSVPHCLRLGAECGITRAQHEAGVRALRQVLESEVRRFPNARLVDPSAFLCSDSSCPAVRDGVALYLDEAHATFTTARAFAETWPASSGAVPGRRSMDSR
jgi:peptidoglycan/LPS O-acetylase OafA/YrhL